MSTNKNVAVAVEFAEKVALARARFSKSSISQMDLDWHDTRWKKFQSSNEIEIELNMLVKAFITLIDVEEKLKADNSDNELFLKRATIFRTINQIKHKLFFLISELYKE